MSELQYLLELGIKINQEKDVKEINAIRTFFNRLKDLNPDIISGYNSENFDWGFFVTRCEMLGFNIEDIAHTLNRNIKFQRKKGTLKLGAETEYYQQSLIWGTNVIDVSHSVRRAQAINSDIKKWGLKYITEFSEANKPNRVYVDGDKIYKTWIDRKSQYAFNDENGDWYKITEERPLKEGYTIKRGDYIIQRYLKDDLWETEKVDEIYSQASFLLSKMLPTEYTRTLTMGTATLWRLIMLAWSYENDLAVPETEDKRDFTGGLSRLLEVGRAEDVVKLDYAALYPNVELTHDIFPKLDISGVMKGLLLYIADTRDEYKNLKNVYAAQGDTYLESMYDKKQLPLKILANSFFGSLGAPYLFNWGDSNAAEETTCRGRIYLRLMVKHFSDLGFRPLVGDTDGFNFAVPKNVNEFKYIGKGLHRFTEEGKEYIGTEAAVAEFNDKYMDGRMGLDIDEYCRATINFSRKNYADIVIKKNGEKIKLVGNTIKSKKMPIYIEEFLAKGIVMLLEGDGQGFLEYYYDYVDKIYNCQIPLMKIASKGRVKLTKKEYLQKCKQVNKAGNPMPRQAHMELMLKHDLDLDLGDTIYYVNTGTAKSHGDIKTIKHKDGSREIELNCKLIPAEQIENNPDLTTDEYNVLKYITMFNKRIKPLLVVFNQEIRDDIVIEAKKVKHKKKKAKKGEPTPEVLPDEIKLEPRKEFTKAQCVLVAGQPYNIEDQDTFDELMAFEDKELKFWSNVDVEPNNLSDLGISKEEWDEMLYDYHVREKAQMELDFKNEVKKFNDIANRIELNELNQFIKFCETDLNKALVFLENYFPFLRYEINEVDGVHLISKKHNRLVGRLSDIINNLDEAAKRDVFYSTLHINYNGDRYQAWLDHVASIAEIVNSGDTNEIPTEVKVVKEEIIEEIKPVINSITTIDDDDEWNF